MSLSGLEDLKALKDLVLLAISNQELENEIMKKFTKLEELGSKGNEETEGEEEEEDNENILVDIEPVIDSLTTGLYSKGVTSAILREAIQNAKDAYSRAFYLLKNNPEELVSGLKESDISPNMIVQMFEDCYILKDFGEGMTKRVLSNHFFAIACSSKRNLIATLAKLIGRFGVGGLTNIKQASHLIVISKNIYDGKTMFQMVRFGVGKKKYKLSKSVEVTENNMDFILSKFKHKRFTKELLAERVHDKKYGTTILTVLKEEHFLDDGKVNKMVTEARNALKYCEGKVEIEARLNSKDLDEVKKYTIEKEEFIFPQAVDAIHVNRPGIPRRLFHEHFHLKTRCEIPNEKPYNCEMKFDVKYEIGFTDDKRIFVLFKGEGNMSKKGGKKESEDYKLNDHGLLWVTHNNAMNIRFYSNKYLVMNFEKCVLRPVTVFPFIGDLNISCLNPLTNRDTLIQSDNELIRSLLERVQRSIWIFLKEDGIQRRNAKYINTFLHGYCQLGVHHFDVSPWKSIGPLMIDTINGEGVINKMTFQEIQRKRSTNEVEKVFYCTNYRSEMTAFATKSTLLVSLNDIRGFRYFYKLACNFMSVFAKNIDGFRFRNLMTLDKFLSYEEAKRVFPKYLSNEADKSHEKFISLYKACAYVLYDYVYFRCPRESVIIKFGETEGVNAISFFEHSRKHKKMDVYINVASTKLRDDGDVSVDLLSYYRVIFEKYFCSKFGLLNQYYSEKYNPSKALGKKKLTCSSFRKYNPGGGGSGYWEGPDENLIEYCGKGYFFKAPMEYSTGSTSWAPAFPHRSGKNVCCVKMTENAINILLDYYNAEKNRRMSIQYWIMISDKNVRNLPNISLPSSKTWTQEVYYHWPNKIYLPIPKEFFPFIDPREGGVEVTFEMDWK